MAKTKTLKRRIKKAKIQFISLCPKGMNTIETVYKAEGEEESKVVLSTLTKDMTEQGILIAVVYAPDMVDGEGDTASAKVIKDFAYDFAAHGSGVDIRHNEEKLGDQAFVAESFIIQKGDPRFEDMKDYEGSLVDVTGGWGVVIKIQSEELRKQYRNNQWAGVSMGGLMQVEEVGKEYKLLNKFMDLIYNKKEAKITEKSMDPKELQKMVQKTVEASIEEIKKSLSETKTKKEDKKKKEIKGMGYVAPVLKDGATDEEIEQHKKNLTIFEISKAVDRGDIDSVSKFMALKQDIIDGKKVETKKEGGDKPYNAFNSNQKDTEVVNRSANQTDNPVADDILKTVNKEDYAKK